MNFGKGAAVSEIFELAGNESLALEVGWDYMSKTAAREQGGSAAIDLLEERFGEEENSQLGAGCGDLQGLEGFNRSRWRRKHIYERHDKTRVL